MLILQLNHLQSTIDYFTYVTGDRVQCTSNASQMGLVKYEANL